MEKLTTTLRTGNPWPLGSHWDGYGVNFAVFSDHAEAIELCLFDNEGVLETGHVLLPARTGNVWHGYLPQAKPGLVYGLRAYGPWNPGKGQRFNAHKLLLDPYARALVGRFDWRDEHFAAQTPTPEVMDTRDNATHALKARVVDEAYDWDDDKPPTVPLADTVLYELHVKGFSQRNPAVPEALRGSYAGLAHEASITHLKQLGVTSLSLLPVHYALDEERLVSMGLTNYWGYNSIAFFAPASRLASGHGGVSPHDEFRAMIKALHAQGLEVLLDVVYNHTAESDHTGPTLSFRGLDNASYYRLRTDDLSLYENHTGCGNTLDLRHPRVLQLVLDSLRFWVTDMHVDGFTLIWHRFWAAVTMVLTATPHFLRLSPKIRFCRASNSLPNPGTLAPGVTNWVSFRAVGWSGMTAFATPCGGFGCRRVGTPIAAASLRCACVDRQTTSSSAIACRWSLSTT